MSSGEALLSAFLKLTSLLPQPCSRISNYVQQCPFILFSILEIGKVTRLHSRSGTHGLGAVTSPKDAWLLGPPSPSHKDHGMGSYIANNFKRGVLV